MIEQVMTEEEVIVRRLLWVATTLWILVYAPIMACICFIHGVNLIGGLGTTKAVRDLLTSKTYVSDSLWAACKKYGMDKT